MCYTILVVPEEILLARKKLFPLIDAFFFVQPAEGVGLYQKSSIRKKISIFLPKEYGEICKQINQAC